MEETYNTSCYIKKIMLKILGKTGGVQKNQQNYLEKQKFSFSLTDHGTSIGQPAYLFYFAPASYFKVKKLFYDIYGMYIFSDRHFFRI